MTLADRLQKARVASTPEVSDRAKRGLAAYVGAQAHGTQAIADLADGTAATAIGQLGLSAMSPTGLDCASGCAFCCILSGDDGGTITGSGAVCPAQRTCAFSRATRWARVASQGVPVA